MSQLPVKIDRQTARKVATALAYLRAGFGIGAILLPKLVMRPWIGVGCRLERGQVGGASARRS